MTCHLFIIEPPPEQPSKSSAGESTAKPKQTNFEFNFGGPK